MPSNNGRVRYVIGVTEHGMHVGIPRHENLHAHMHAIHAQWPGPPAKVPIHQ